MPAVTAIDYILGRAMEDLDGAIEKLDMAYKATKDNGDSRCGTLYWAHDHAIQSRRRLMDTPLDNER